MESTRTLTVLAGLSVAVLSSTATAADSQRFVTTTDPGTWEFGESDQLFNAVARVAGRTSDTWKVGLWDMRGSGMSLVDQSARPYNIAFESDTSYTFELTYTADGEVIFTTGGYELRADIPPSETATLAALRVDIRSAGGGSATLNTLSYREADGSETIITSPTDAPLTAFAPSTYVTTPTAYLRSPLDVAGRDSITLLGEFSFDYSEVSPNDTGGDRFAVYIRGFEAVNIPGVATASVLSASFIIASVRRRRT